MGSGTAAPSPPCGSLSKPEGRQLGPGCPVESLSHPKTSSPSLVENPARAVSRCLRTKADPRKRGRRKKIIRWGLGGLLLEVRTMPTTSRDFMIRPPAGSEDHACSDHNGDSASHLFKNLQPGELPLEILSGPRLKGQAAARILSDRNWMTESKPSRNSSAASTIL